jgi:RNA polymerase primary sigma factor
MARMLYQWQREAFEAWAAHEHRGVIEAITGSGKTRLGVLAARAALVAGYKVVVMVPTIELLDQWTRTLHDELPEVTVGRLGGGRHDDLHRHDLVIGTVHSIAPTFDHDAVPLLSRHRQGLVIADECHRYAADRFAGALSEHFDWRLGLTATYERADGLHEEVLDPFFGGVVHRLWYDRALAEGVIAPFDIALVGVELDAGPRARYDALSKQIRETRQALLGYLPAAVCDRHAGGAGDAGEGMPFPVLLRFVTAWAASPEESPRRTLASRLLGSIAERRGLLADAPAKIDAVGALAPAVRRAHGSLVFAETKDAARAASARLADAGLRTAAVCSGLGREERHDRLGRLRDGEIDVLAAPRVLDEGIDVPDADLGIVVAASRSRRQMVQRLGRVIRRKRPPRAGRLVHLYALRTVEDPEVSGDEHLAAVLEHARRHRVFTGVDDPGLLPFLVEPVPVDDREPDLVAEPELFGLDLDGDDAAAAGPVEQAAGIHVCADAFHDWLRVIGRYGLLTAEEEVVLGTRRRAGAEAAAALERGEFTTRRERTRLERRVRDGRRAWEAFICANLRLVVSISTHYSAHRGIAGLDPIDLVQESHPGLMRAVQKFDERRGLKFSTYATWWIRQSITRALAEKSRTIRVPVHADEQIKKIRRSAEQVVAAHPELVTAEDGGRRAVVSRVAELLDESIERVEWLLARDAPIQSLDEPRWIVEDDRVTLGTLAELLPDERTEQEFEELERTEIVESLLLSLDQRECLVLEARFGLLTGEEETLDQVGARLGVTRERARQIQKKALEALRVRCVEWEVAQPH